MLHFLYKTVLLKGCLSQSKHRVFPETGWGSTRCPGLWRWRKQIHTFCRRGNYMVRMDAKDAFMELFCSSHRTFTLDFWCPAPSFHQRGNCRTRFLHTSSCGAFAPLVVAEPAYVFSEMDKVTFASRRQWELLSICLMQIVMERSLHEPMEDVSQGPEATSASWISKDTKHTLALSSMF